MNFESRASLAFENLEPKSISKEELKNLFIWLYLNEEMQALPKDKIELIKKAISFCLRRQEQE